MCGSLGTGLPSWWTVTPCSYRAPASSSAETNCEDCEASSVTYRPIVAVLLRIGDRARTVQNGDIHRYLAFSFAALLLVLVGLVT